MADSKKGSKIKTVTSRLSVHVIFYSCPDCGHEIEHVQFCDKCGKEMRVVDVVEKFGSEAQEIIEKIKSLQSDKTETEEESPNIILMSEEDEDTINGADDDANTITEDEVMELDEIFEDTEGTDGNEDALDISDLTEELDKSDDEKNTLEDLDIDPEDLPEL